MQVVIQSEQVRQFVSVHRTDETVLYWPPPLRARRMTYFVPLAIDDFTPLEPGACAVRDDFPTPGHVMAAMPAPNGRAMLAFGAYGEWWPTDPDVREHCVRGGFLTGPDGRHRQVSLVEGAPCQN